MQIVGFKIKRAKVHKEVHHIGTYSLPSDHAISAHCEIVTGQPPKWIYSEDPEGLKPEDLAFWNAEILPTLENELKQKTGVNRQLARRLIKLKESTL